MINPKLLRESTYIHQVDEGAYAAFVEGGAARPTRKSIRSYANWRSTICDAVDRKLLPLLDNSPCEAHIHLLTMLKWTVICAALAVIFGVLGFGGIAAGFAAIAKILFGIFVLGVILTLVLGATVFRTVTR